MTYFDPSIYCKQNLKEEDKKELEFYKGVFDNALEQALNQFDLEYGNTASAVFDSMQEDIVNSFAEEVKQQIGFALQELVVGIIDNYPEDADVDPIDDPETFYYCPDDEDCEEE